ncbi:MAG TPA: ATP-binding protein [Tepidisphaeraceae bacterium]
MVEDTYEGVYAVLAAASSAIAPTYRKPWVDALLKRCYVNSLLAVNMPVTQPASQSRHDMATAPLAIAAIGVLVASLMATAAWALRSQQQSMVAARDQRIEVIGSLLATEAEDTITSGEVSRLRRVVIETARTWSLATCRIVLGGHKIVADANPKNINTAVIPATWADEPAAPSDSLDVRSFPIAVAGRGIAQLEIAPAAAAADYWQTSAGVGAVGTMMLASLLVLYRRARSRLRPLWVVRDALLSAGDGELHPERLEVDATLGPEAVAWNRVMAVARRNRREILTRDNPAAVAGVREPGGADLDAACDSMSSGLLLVDSRLRVKFGNGAAAVYLRTPREELVGKTAADVFKDAELLRAVQSVASGTAQRAITLEVRQPEEGGAGVLRFTVRQVRKGDGGAAMIVIDDVTQQRVADAARNSFVAHVAHELRTPLTNIRLYVETAIEDETQDPAAIQNALNIINQESRRLERTVSEMLSVSEIEAGSLRLRRDDVHMDVLLKEAKVDFVQQAKDKNITFELSLPPKIAVIQGDRDKIALTVHNLVGNALKYTPKGGRVTVTLGEQEGKVSVEVADTGIGIKPEEAELVFDRFYRSTDERVASITGTGLGLTLAREIARLHGGDITLDSQIDKGSTFTLWMPSSANES